MCVLAAAKLIDAIGGNRGRAAKLVRRNSLPNLGIDPKKSRKPSVFIITDLISIYPKEMYEKGIATIVSSKMNTGIEMKMSTNRISAPSIHPPA